MMPEGHAPRKMFMNASSAAYLNSSSDRRKEEALQEESTAWPIRTIIAPNTMVGLLMCSVSSLLSSYLISFLKS